MEYWQDPLHKEFHHLFETNEAEAGTEGGEILRGIECGRAWERIVRQLLERLDWLRTHNTRVKNPAYNPDLPDNADNLHYYDNGGNDIKVFQIKEKFGRFRAHVTAPDHIEYLVENAIGYAEGQADLTCYGCGALGYFDMSNLDYIVRLCPTCLSQRAADDEAEL